MLSDYVCLAQPQSHLFYLSNSVHLSVHPSSVSLVSDSFYDTFHTTADMMYFCQMMAVIEIINPLLGLVKTGFFPAMLQVLLILRNIYINIDIQGV